jgi:hypothetical protein
MRRILRKIAAGEEDSIGDITTLSDPSVNARRFEYHVCLLNNFLILQVVPKLIQAFADARKSKS